MRDPDGWTYFKEEVGGLVVGGFEPDAKPWRAPSDLPHPFEFQLLEEDWEHFAPGDGAGDRRVPALAETGIRKFYNGPESFTPDNQFLLGQAPGLRGYFVGAGLQLGRHRLGGRCGPGAGGVGRRRVSRPATWSRSTYAGSRRSTATRRGCDHGWPRSSGCTTRCRGRSASRRPADRSGVSPLHDRLAGRAAPCSGAGWAGSARWCSAAVGRRRHPRHERTPGDGRTGCPGASRSSARPGSGSRSSTRRRSRCTTSPAPTRSAACSGSARPTWTYRSAAASTRRSSTSRGTYEADLTVTRTGCRLLPAGLELGHDDPRPGLDRPPPSGRAPT